MSWEVQQWTLFQGWINGWTISDDHGDMKPERFATEAEALAELRTYFAERRLDQIEDVFEGHRAPSEIDGDEDMENYRVVELL